MNRLTLLLLATAVALSACSDRAVTDFETPDGPIADVFRIPTTSASLHGLDATFAEIARQIPGFGGLYFDEQGRPNVYMAADGATPFSTDALAAELNAQMQARGLDGSVSAQDLIVRTGVYDFQQLSRYHRDVVPVLSAPGVVFTDADETTNRIVIGVEEGTSPEAIQAMVEQLGVPVAAVSVVVTEPITALQSVADLATSPLASSIGGLPTLRDEVRPIAGGLQIWRLTSPTTASICTLGFNAAAPTVSQGRLMFTNSHCTAVRGQVTGTEYNQKQLAFPLDIVAVEVEDPPFFTNADDPACPVGRNCRWSDAAAAEYIVPNSDVAFPRTMAPFPGTLVLPDATRTFRVAAEATSRAIFGQGLMKVGRTSGLTGAAVIATCQNANVAGAGSMTMLCQERVAINSIGGDSGSPVIESMDARAFMDVTANQRVRLHGLLWGGSGNTYVFSSMLNIRMDFPGPWIVH